MTATAKPRVPTALLVNDHEWSARSLESILTPRGFTVLRAHTARQALSLARTSSPDVVIVDMRLPDVDGIDVCERLRADGHVTAATPIIVTTSGQATRAQRLAALRAGAWDFLTQPLDGEALLLKLDSFLEARRESLLGLEASLVDSATGLYNGRGLARRAREIGAEAQRRRQSLACVALEAEVGPAAPDAELPDAIARDVAEQVASICRSAGRASDAFGRVGRLEFAIIAPATTADGATRLAERMKARLEQIPVALDGEARPVRVRAGYYAVPDFASSALDAEEILHRATAALRQLRADGSGVDVRSFDDVPRAG